MPKSDMKEFKKSKAYGKLALLRNPRSRLPGHEKIANAHWSALAQVLVKQPGGA